MFLDFYNLREQPFGVTPNPAFLYLSHSHREALASLFYAVENERGFAALIAPPGMGKTTLLFHMLEKLRPSSHTAFLFQTQCDSSQLLRYLLADLGRPTEERDLVKLHFELNEILVREARAGRRLVVVIDEAQGLDESVLETLRLLSDFETPTRKLMQIILAGQPQLAEKLARPELSQLLQRFYIVSRLAPFNSEETHGYVEHRLKVAGYGGQPLFQPEAFELIATHSQGIPRVINNLCFHALTLGFAKKQRTIDAATVRNALSDLNLQHSTTVELSASSISKAAHDRGLRKDSTAATKFPSHGGVAAAQPGWVKNTPLLAQEGVGGGPPQTETTSANPEMAVKLPSPGGVAATQPGWVNDSNAHGRLSSANPRDFNESSGPVELGPPGQELIGSPLPSEGEGLGVRGTAQISPMPSVSGGRSPKLGRHSVEEKPTMNGTSTFIVATNTPAKPVSLQSNSSGGLSSAKPVVSTPASSRSWSLTYPGLAACLALALLACFGYMSYRAGIPAPEFGWLQPKVTVSTQASFIPTSTPSKENISVEQVPASPDQNGLAELPPPASSSQSGIQTSQLPSPGGVAATQPGWAEKAPLLAQEGVGGGPSRTADNVSVVSGGDLVVVVAPNQTLCQICLDHLGRYSLSLVEEIFRLNPRLKDPNFIMAGQRLQLPVKSEQRREPTPRNAERATAVAQED